jgi:uncharacterized membrane protein (DUF4010 family)
MPFEWVGLAVALGCGLLIGVERERRKGRGVHRGPAGVRSFAVTALAGAIAQTLQSPLLVAAGALLVLLLAVISHWKSQSADPGITTELALFVTYLLGVTAMRDATLAAGGAAVVAILLASRHRLHRFATRTLHATELRDALILAGAALIVLPLVPSRSLDWLAGFNPRRMWSLVVLLLVLQAAGYVAMRAVGPRIGLALSGLASGFVSSTATFAAMGARVKANPALRRAAIGGALMSNIATILQLLLVTLTVSPAMLAILWPVFVAGVVVSVVVAAAYMRSGRQEADQPALERAFDLGRSMMFAGLLAGVTALAAWAGSHFGESGLALAAALAGLVDVHAASASVATLVQAEQISPGMGLLPVLLAFSTNTASKLLSAYIGGGLRFAIAVLPGLLILLAAVWGAGSIAVRLSGIELVAG